MHDKVIPSFDKNRTVLGKVLPLRTPFTVILDSSERCNFRCCYCFRSQMDIAGVSYTKSNEIMTYETFKECVQQLKQFPDALRQISLSHQGEPLCNPRVPDMATYIKEQGIKGRISIHSNGSLLTPELAIRLAESGIDRIVFSIQGLSTDKYIKICNTKIDFDKFRENLAILYQHKKDMEISIKIVDAALEQGEEDLFFNMFESIADRVFIEKVVPIWENMDYKGMTDKSAADDENKYGEHFEKQQCCPLVFHTLVVVPNGDVYPCTQPALEEKLGNIKDKTLVEMWNGDLRKKLLVSQLELNSPQICKECYIPQNSIYTKEDMIDKYRNEIFAKLI